MTAFEAKCCLSGNAKMPRLYDSRKRVLVTGGAGFIGSHLTDKRLAEGHGTYSAQTTCSPGQSGTLIICMGTSGSSSFRHDITFPLYGRG